MDDHQENAYEIYHEWKDWTESSFGVGSPELHRAYAALLRTYSWNSGGHAIDFGFGNGEMLATLRSLGFDTTGIERNPVLREMAGRKGFSAAETLFDNQLPACGSVALITALHVLEHLDKDALGATLLRCSALLQSGGILLTAFPNGDSPFSASAFNGDITHATWIGSSMAAQLGAMSGLKLMAYRPFPPLSRYSSRLSVRAKGFLRSSAERVLSGVLSMVYYGGSGKVLSPVVVAVWTKA